MTGTFVVAEAGLNHNGSLARALDMARAAAAAGCTGFKLQAYTASEFVGPDETYSYIERDGTGGFRRITERQRDMFDRCALTFEEISQVHAECVRLGVDFVVTATDADWIEKVATLRPRVALKIGSDDIIHSPLLQAAKASGLPVILSTGMATAEEIERAVDIVKPLALLHCVSLYPTPSTKANLLRMVFLARFGVPVGFSDHTDGPLAATMATAMGAVMIEKHFTLDRSLPGPDHWFSADPAGMKALVGGVRLALNMRGTGLIDPGPEEVAMRAVARRSVVAARDIPVGALLKAEMVAYRRPGGGLPPGHESGLLGRVTSRRIVAGEQISEDAFMRDVETAN